MRIEQVIDQFCENPKRLFLLDALGAIVSAFLLGVVLVQFEALFGIPSSTLYALAAIPVLFALFDFYSSRQDRSKLSGLLKAIASMNLLYCLLSLGLAFFHFSSITILGWAYILGEIGIISVLALLELRVAKRLITK